jgi:arabinan endo-1,5-alpha-L-arabinosidase
MVSKRILKNFRPAFLIILLFASAPAKADVGELVLNADFADPTLIREPNGEYFAYSTQAIRVGPNGPKIFNFQVARSLDGVHWRLEADAMPVKPKWASRTQRFWAPDVVQSRGKYLMYFSAQLDQALPAFSMCIGVARANSPLGPFVDIGAPLICGPEFDVIDPMAFRDPVSGKNYLYWGSNFQPIRTRELNAEGDHFLEGSATIEVLRPNPTSLGYTKLLEGSSVFYRGGYYYLLVSGDSCCDPVHYAVIVSRSKSPLGPFVYHDSNENPLIQADAKWIGTGHNGLITDSHGNLWIYFHAIDRRNPELSYPNGITPRRVMLRALMKFRDGWPIVFGPSSKPR